MQNYRQALREHFESQPYLRRLLTVDAAFYGTGLLLLLFHVFSDISVRSDVLFAFGFWLFWIGTGLGFIKKNDVGLSIGLGFYALLCLAGFIRAFTYFSGAYYGFYGFTPLCNLVAASALLTLTVQESDYYKNYRERQKALLLSQSVMKAQQAPTETLRCFHCGGVLAENAAFCQRCGTKIPEVTRCGQCGSPLPETVDFCVICGAGTNEDGSASPIEAAVESCAVEFADRSLCSSCGATMPVGKKFCTKCGTKL